MPAVIKIENLSKAYQLGEIGTGTLTRDLERYWARVRGKEDPFLKIGEENNRAVKGQSDIVWSLKDLNFEIEQGDAVGIIGRNGAGKSTLLKILSRVTAPTTGSVKVKGRIASLLEVGTGFHPELSGRENIYLNGAILGMRKAEIKRKFDEIVDFSGVERYIDTPVKRYSSGMYVRLAFAVAAHLESEIMIVDEVLAVGDAEFQKKCLGKMGDVSKGEGRTVLFVSHNMGAVQKLCNNGILLENGKIDFNGTVTQCVEKYLDQNNTFAAIAYPIKLAMPAQILKVGIYNNKHVPASDIAVGTAWEIHIEFILNEYIGNFVAAIGLTNVFGVALNTTWQKGTNLNPGKYLIIFYADKINFALGKYYIHASISKGKNNIEFIENAVSFNIAEGNHLIEDHLVNIEYATGAVIDQMNYCLTNI